MNKKIFSTILLSFSALLTIAQTSQIIFGETGYSYTLVDSKLDESDGGTVSVGYLNNLSAGNGTDLFIVKLNSQRQLVWQKTIANPGEDYYNRVIICNNGDYVTVGQMFVDGIRRGIASRFSHTDGTLLWSVRSSNSASGELFRDVIETANNNIAIVGADRFVSSQTNSFLTLLNASGTTIWSYYSSTASADEFMSINQLPNNNLIVAGFFTIGSSRYAATISEISETDGSILSQNYYSMATTVPNWIYSLNSLWPIKISINNNVVYIHMLAFQGFGTPSQTCIFTYDESTKNLNGNIYYRTGGGSANGLSFLPISATDFLISQSFGIGGTAYVSRISSNAIVYDRAINSNIGAAVGMNIAGSALFLTGNAVVSGNTQAYLFVGDTNLPTQSNSCNVTDANSLNIQNSPLLPTTSSVVTIPNNATILAQSLNFQSTNYNSVVLCGAPLPVNLTSFTGKYISTENATLLNWSTSQEINSKEFIIERSIDGGLNFTEIYRLQSTGNSQTTRNYLYKDKFPAFGSNYYRLKQVDIDNRIQYSKIISIEVPNTKNQSFLIYPNPAGEKVTILRTDASYMGIIDLTIFDLSGKPLIKKSTPIPSSGQLTLNLSTLAAGAYILQLQIPGKKPEIHKIIKN